MCFILNTGFVIEIYNDTTNWASKINKVNAYNTKETGINIKSKQNKNAEKSNRSEFILKP
jgi:hypothetical protein